MRILRRLGPAVSLLAAFPGVTSISHRKVNLGPTHRCLGTPSSLLTPKQSPRRAPLFRNLNRGSRHGTIASGKGSRVATVQGLRLYGKELGSASDSPRAGKQMSIKYGLIIYWSDQDQSFVVEVPELPGTVPGLMP